MTGYDQPLYVLPFDHRGSFETKMFGWHGDLTPAQTAEIAAAKQVIYDGFKAAVAAWVQSVGLGVGSFEFQRTVSRLEEMRSAEYLSEGHGVAA